MARSTLSAALGEYALVVLELLLRRPIRLDFAAILWV
jgi:hypothetical protein